ncbi:eukaryotic translation initiation factor 5B-like [Bombus vosnesenskii]|uniref:Eukaryotic translation initiation factor 5B-like n=1 Tax=Bombus vosnesenskii TaxID=207650 RepID=A0A6J3KS07_9HYME|nr:eukaryotic translation initiation factor 5B-like [Bombus vosnesenskii]
MLLLPHHARTIPAKLCLHPRPVDNTSIVRFLLLSRVFQRRIQVPNNAQANGYVIENQNSKLDPSIERIFRSAGEQRNDLINSKRNIDAKESGKAAQVEDADKRARVKRDNAVKKSTTKSLNEAAKDEKRSTSNKAGKSASRIDRSSRDLPKLPDKDYEAPVDQEKFEYADEAEDESAVGSKHKETRYKGNDHVNEDSARFIDQEERSNLYDDFESKDVVKRGISGSEDYEEMDDDALAAAEDTAALEDNASDEETDKRKVHGDVRVKRDHENSKETDNAEVAGKAANLATSSDLSSDQKTAETSLKRDTATDKDSKVAEARVTKADKDSNDQSKRNVVDKNENEASKINCDRETDNSKQPSTSNDQKPTIEGSETAKILAQGSEEATGDAKTREINLSGNDKAANELVGDASGVKETSKAEESKIADVASSADAAKVEVVANAAETSAADDSEKLANSKNEAETAEQIDEDYQKRVEEQIQRKIDSIKEQIKREIEENQRLKDIEENNARFDELRELEEDEEEQAPEVALTGDDAPKRSVADRNSGKSRIRDNVEKQSIKRKKRQDSGQEKTRDASDSSSNKKSWPRTVKKRSIMQSETIPKKHARQAFLTRTDRKKKRKRRSKNSMLIPEQRNVKLEESLPADYTLDSNLRGALADAKPSASKMTEDEKAVAEQGSLLEKRSDSVASLTGSNEEMGPLATEYGEAFGGLNGDPGMALARFKRIKRVLRPPASKT